MTFRVFIIKKPNLLLITWVTKKSYFMAFITLGLARKLGEMVQVIVVNGPQLPNGS